MLQLEVKNLKKSFGQSEVLKGVSFSLEKGEVLSIIGSSGGGKTTLLRCLNFLETADSGEIFIGEDRVFEINENGEPETMPEAQRMMGLVFQQFNLFPQYSVIGNLMLAPRLHAKKKEIFAEIEHHAEEILHITGLYEKKDSYPYQLSGGQQQRVAIARALMLSPKILCFDEPTSALDPELTGEVLKVIRELKNSDRTMVIVTHELEFAKNVSDKIMYMADGQVEAFGTPDEVLHSENKKLQAFLSAGFTK